MSRRVYIVTILAALVAVLTATAAQAFAPVKRAPLGFGVVCSPAVTHAAFDPIVYPGKYRVGHKHTFFGAANINPSSTNTSLRNARGTSCKLSGDKAAYWLPKANYGVREMIAYYKPVPGKDNGPYTVHSGNLRIIAGAVPGDGRTRPSPHVQWGCQGEFAADDSRPVNCFDRRAKVEIEFPDCQQKNGGRFVNDSRNHRRHMAYSNSRGQCPSTHPVKVTKLHLHVIYMVRDGRKLRFTVPHYDMHADFMNGWRQRVLSRAISHCIVGERYGCQRKQIRQLLLEKDLSDDKVRTLLRAQTLTILAGLDNPARKRILLQFLYESDLVIKGHVVVDLRGANLRGANLSAVNLRGANLRGPT